MATTGLTGVNATLVAAGLKPSTLLKAQLLGGKVRVMEDIVTHTGAGDIGSLMTFGPLPKGCIPLFAIMNYSVGSSTLTLAAGVFAAATAVTTTKVQILAAVDPRTALTAATDVVFTTAAAATGSTDVFQFQIFYSVE